MYRSPALASAYDYYPFGMLMPDRYVSDTSHQCVTLTQTKWVTTWVDSCWDVSKWVWPLYQVYGGGHAEPRISDVAIYLFNPGDAVSFGLSGVPDVQQEITLQVSSFSGSMVMEGYQEIGGLWVSMGSIALVNGRNTLKVVPSQTDYRVHIKGTGLAVVERMCAKVPSLSQESMLVDVCDDDGDRYRFGFNGQEKVNEWAGIGNFMDFAFRGYDSRVGRFISVDPLSRKYPWNSPYAFAENRVIDGSDLEGKEWRSTTQDNATKLTLTVVVVNKSSIYTNEDIKALEKDIKPAFKEAYTKRTPLHNYTANIVFQSYADYQNRKSSDPYVVYLMLRDQISRRNEDNGTEEMVGGTTTVSKGNDGGTQSGSVNVYVTKDGEKRKRADIVKSSIHEMGHKAGLPHPWELGSPIDISIDPDAKFNEIPEDMREAVKRNIMNSDANPVFRLRSTNGREFTDGQMDQMRTTIEQQQPTLNTGNGIMTPEQYSAPQKQ